MPNKRRRLVGRVVSDIMDKTIVVAVETTKQHRLYGKTMTTVKKYLAHDESNAIPVGSIVRIVESRPLSKRKRWAVEAIVQEISEAAAEAAASEAQLPEAQAAAAELLAEAGPAEAEAALAEAGEGAGAEEESAAATEEAEAAPTDAETLPPEGDEE